MFQFVFSFWEKYGIHEILNGYLSDSSLSFVLIFISLFLGWITHKSWTRSNSKKKYETLSKIHRKIQQEKIDLFLRTHPAPKKALFSEISNASVSEIVSATISGRWKVEDVVLTYCHLAGQVHGKTNCLTEILFEDALERARILDKLDIKTGCLFGVPISIKDHLAITGHPCSVGVFKWKDEIIEENEKIIEDILAAGGVPFCKTNVPQTMMSFECSNPLWGVTENPKLPGFSPGGSSGGEGALIGAGGSVLGLGSDIAGSLRIPAHFSGVCALRPSNHRMPHFGGRSFHEGSVLIHGVHGPMGRTVNDLIPLLHACMGKSDVDIVPSLPFQELPSDKKLRFGVIRHISFLEALPPCVRAVDEAVDALKNAGHEVVEFEFPIPVKEIISLFYGIISADGGYFYKKALVDEPVEEILKPFFFLMGLPNIVLRFFGFMAGFYKDKRPRLFLDALGTKDSIKVLDMLGERQKMIFEINQYWKEIGIDCLVMPAFATPATPHGSFPHLSFAASYTFIWNILDYVAGVLPVTTVNAEKDKLVRVTKKEDFDQGESSRLFEAEIEFFYDPVKMSGLPIGVQVIAPQYCEAEAIRGMQVLEKALKRTNE